MTWSSFFKLSPITCSKRTTNISLPSFQRFKGGKRTPRQPLCSVDEIRFQNVASKLTWQERHEFEPRRSLFRFVVFCFVLFCFCFIYSAHAQKQRRNNDRKKNTIPDLRNNVTKLILEKTTWCGCLSDCQMRKIVQN